MINLPEFDLYLFDLDDTLINTRQAYYSAQESAVSKVFPNLTGKVLADRMKELKWLCQIFGSGQPENYFSAFVKNLSESTTAAKRYVEELLEIYHPTFQKNLKPFKGAIPYLHSLFERNKPIATVSNGKTATQLTKLQRTGLDAYFTESQCFISEMVLPTQKKPSPHMLELACHRTGVSPDRTVYFGNISADILAGNIAGTTTVLYGEDSEMNSNTPDIAKPDFRIGSWEE